MTTLTRDWIEQSAATLDSDHFEVSFLGMTAKARRLRHSQLAEYESWFSDKKGNVIESRVNLRRERLIGLCLLNDDGSLMFEGEDYRELAKCESGFVCELYRQIEAGCGLRAMNEAKTVKNSEGD